MDYIHDAVQAQFEGDVDKIFTSLEAWANRESPDFGIGVDVLNRALVNAYGAHRDDGPEEVETKFRLALADTKGLHRQATQMRRWTNERVQRINRRLSEVFSGDQEAIGLWWITAVPELGNVSPQTAVYRGFAMSVEVYADEVFLAPAI